MPEKSFGDNQKLTWGIGSQEAPFTEILTDDSVGRTFARRTDWQNKWEEEKFLLLQELKRNRDPASDIQEITGVKPNFADEWSENQPDQFIQVSGGGRTYVIQNPRLNIQPGDETS
ncbi:MAG: hypothetical protein KDH96_09970 [Candidatus Riesia sp.]|nr:hypothetical protein [Candidatus Riesia sp.]